MQIAMELVDADGGTDLVAVHDPCSSAVWFDGWSSAIAVDARWKRELLERPPPTARPKTWLLSVGWRRHGALRFDETPGSSVARH